MNSVIVLNFNELEISKDSVHKLLQEKPRLEVIVVDNGSEDGSKEYFHNLECYGDIKFVDLPENMGASVGRNKGIEVAKGDNIFLLDGDILYVKGTITEYEKILKKNPDAYCVGQNSIQMITETGYNGVVDPIEADMYMDKDYKIEDWFPMAWTQYGLFRGDLLRKVKFHQEGYFGKPGYGFEDDWLNHEMKELGFVSLSVDKPIYYHMAHSGQRELFKQKKEDNMKKRLKEFEKKWGKGNVWVDLLKKGITRTYR